MQSGNLVAVAPPSLPTVQLCSRIRITGMGLQRGVGGRARHKRGLTQWSRRSFDKAIRKDDLTLAVSMQSRTWGGPACASAPGYLECGLRCATPHSGRLAVDAEQRGAVGAASPTAKWGDICELRRYFTQQLHLHLERAYWLWNLGACAWQCDHALLRSPALRKAALDWLILPARAAPVAPIFCFLAE